MRVLSPLVLWCAVLASPLLARAQQAPAAGAPAQEQPAEAFEEIERGVYFAVMGGPLFVVNPPASQGPRPFAPGQAAALELGVDLGELLSVGVFAQGASNRAGSDYVGFSGGAASGDFSTLVAGGVARLHLLGLKDAQEVNRTWVYARVGAGYALFAPQKLLPNPDILVFAGPGVEYYTRLRHFSVGLEVTGSFLVASQSFGFAITPNLRYAF